MKHKKTFFSLVAMPFFLIACDKEEKNEQVKASAPILSTQEKQTKESVDIVVEATSKENAFKPSNAEMKYAESGNMIKNEQEQSNNWRQGKVQYFNLEGGFYGIVTESGQRLLPMNLAKEFQQNGALIKVKGTIKNVMTIQQWGTPFTITEIELISAGTGQFSDEM